MSLPTLAVALLLALLGTAMVLRHRAASALAALTALAFPFLAVVALSAVLAPQAYEAAARLGLDRAGVIEQMRQVDDALVLNEVADVSQDLLGRLKDLLADGDEGSEAPSGREPTRLVESMLYPSLQALFALVLRVGAFVLAICGLVAVTALNYAAGIAGEANTLRTRLANLEDRLARIEVQQ